MVSVVCASITILFSADIPFSFDCRLAPWVRGARFPSPPSIAEKNTPSMDVEEEKSCVEVVPIGSSADALTFALMKEKKRSWREHEHVKREGQDEDRGARSPSNASEGERSNDSTLLRMNRTEMSPRKRLDSPKSSTTYISDGSVSSHEEIPKERGRKNNGFFRRIANKFSNRRNKVPPPTITASMSADEILNDLRAEQSPLTRRVTSRITMEQAVQNPAMVKKKALFYRKQAKKLLKSFEAAESQTGDSAQSGNKDAEWTAKKALEYAMEARRLYNLFERSQRTVFEEDSILRPSPVLSAFELVDRSLTEPTQPRFRSFDEESLAERTTFSAELEQKYHRQKMKELVLFAPQDFKPRLRCCDADLGDVYAMEARGLIRSIDKEDDLSVRSPFSTEASVKTSASELVLREEHRKKMDELELFSAANLFSNVWYALTGTFSPQVKTIQEERAIEEENDEDEESELSAASSVASDETASQFSGDSAASDETGSDNSYGSDMDNTDFASEGSLEDGDSSHPSSASGPSENSWRGSFDSGDDDSDMAQVVDESNSDEEDDSHYDDEQSDNDRSDGSSELDSIVSYGQSTVYTRETREGDSGIAGWIRRW